MSNYPDNIRDFDHDPRSPFYDDKGEGDRLNEYLDDTHHAYELFAVVLGTMLDQTGTYSVKDFYCRYLPLFQSVQDIIGTVDSINVEFDLCRVETEGVWETLAGLHDVLEENYPEEYEDHTVSDAYSKQMKSLRDRMDKVKEI